MASINLYCTNKGTTSFVKNTTITLNYTVANGYFIVNSITGYRSDSYSSTYGSDITVSISYPGGSGQFVCHYIGATNGTATWRWWDSGSSSYDLYFNSTGGTGQITITTPGSDSTSHILGSTYQSMTAYNGSATYVTVPAPVSAPSGVSGSASVTSTSATITGSCSSTGGETPSYSIINASGGTVSGMTINGLSPATTYTYQVKATNSAGSTNSGTLSFTTKPNAPSGITGTATATYNSITVTGSCTSTGGEEPTYTIKIKSPTEITYTSNTATGLSPNTTYTYVIVATNSGGSTESQEYTITTADGSDAYTVTLNEPTKTIISGVAIENVGSFTNIKIIDENGNEYPDVTITMTYKPVIKEETINFTINNLIPNTDYTFAIYAEYFQGAIYISKYYTLTTADYASPALSDYSISSDTRGTIDANITVTLDEDATLNNAQSYYVISHTDSMGSVITENVAGILDSNNNYNLEISELEPNTTYVVSVCITDSNNKTANSEKKSIITKANPTTNLSIDCKVNRYNSIKININGTFDTNVDIDPISQVEITDSQSGTIYQAISGKTSYISNITPNHIYDMVFYIKDTIEDSSFIISKKHFKFRCDIFGNKKYAMSMLLNGEEKSQIEMGGAIKSCCAIEEIEE